MLAILPSVQCAAQSQSSALDAVAALKLPKRPRDVLLYYSACCRERAMEVQSALEDCVHFYKEKLGIQCRKSRALMLDWDSAVRRGSQGFGDSRIILVRAGLKEQQFYRFDEQQAG
jgi:hypothetical protein